jgi:hypothetical protein
MNRGKGRVVDEERSALVVDHRVNLGVRECLAEGAKARRGKKHVADVLKLDDGDPSDAGKPRSDAGRIRSHGGELGRGRGDVCDKAVLRQFRG